MVYRHIGLAREAPPGLNAPGRLETASKRACDSLPGQDRVRSRSKRLNAMILMD